MQNSSQSHQFLDENIDSTREMGKKRYATDTKVNIPEGVLQKQKIYKFERTNADS